jgi:CRP-like cAMP-binding protein
MFDGCRAERVFLYLDDPQAALRELVRVSKPRAPIVIGDPDWETLVIDSSDPALTHRIARHMAESVPGGGVAHRVRGLMREAGLEEVAVTPMSIVLTEHTTADLIVQIDAAARRARDAGAITPEEHDAWFADLRARDADDRFLLAFTAYVTIGHKPGERGTRAAPTTPDASKALGRAFVALTETQREVLCAGARTRSYDAGETVLREGAESRALYVVTKGTARVKKDYFGIPVTLDELGPGDVFGEISFVDGAPASASVIAADALELLVIDGIEPELRSDPWLATCVYHSLTAVLARRLRTNTDDRATAAFVAT